jgi:Flp pilus assembly protein TadG
MREPEHGQAAVELAALLPVVAAVLAIAWQLALAGHAAWAASAAARAAARAVAVGGDPGAAARAHLPRRLERGLRVRERGGRVSVSVRRPSMLPSLALGRARAEAGFPSQ